VSSQQGRLLWLRVDEVRREQTQRTPWRMRCSWQLRGPNGLCVCWVRGQETVHVFVVVHLRWVYARFGRQ
jgi:hypothetical protein